jgi:hypothetical protein
MKISLLRNEQENAGRMLKDLTGTDRGSGAMGEWPATDVRRGKEGRAQPPPVTPGFGATLNHLTGPAWTNRFDRGKAPATEPAARTSAERIPAAPAERADVGSLALFLAPSLPFIGQLIAQTSLPHPGLLDGAGPLSYRRSPTEAYETANSASAVIEFGARHSLPN